MTALHHRSGTALPHHRLQRGRWWMRVPVAGCGSGASVSSAAPPPIENFPCMRAGAVPLSSRGTHSAFSQKQSVTSEPSSSLHNLSLARSPSSIRFACRDQHATRHAAHGSFVQSSESQRSSSTGFDHGYRSPAVFRRANPINACASLAIPAIPVVRSSPIIARNVSPFCFMLSESQ